MTGEEVRKLAKEKFGKELTDEQAQDYLNGSVSIPDEALDAVSGGFNGASHDDEAAEWISDTKKKCG